MDPNDILVILAHEAEFCGNILQSKNKLISNNKTLQNYMGIGYGYGIWIFLTGTVLVNWWFVELFNIWGLIFWFCFLGSVFLGYKIYLENYAGTLNAQMTLGILEKIRFLNDRYKSMDRKLSKLIDSTTEEDAYSQTSMFLMIINQYSSELENDLQIRVFKLEDLQTIIMTSISKSESRQAFLTNLIPDPPQFEEQEEEEAVMPDYSQPSSTPWRTRVKKVLSVLWDFTKLAIKNLGKMAIKFFKNAPKFIAKQFKSFLERLQGKRGLTGVVSAGLQILTTLIAGVSLTFSWPIALIGLSASALTFSLINFADRFLSKVNKLSKNLKSFCENIDIHLKELEEFLSLKETKQIGINIIGLLFLPTVSMAIFVPASWSYWVSMNGLFCTTFGSLCLGFFYTGDLRNFVVVLQNELSTFILLLESFGRADLKSSIKHLEAFNAQLKTLADKSETKSKLTPIVTNVHESFAQFERILKHTFDAYTQIDIFHELVDTKLTSCTILRTIPEYYRKTFKLVRKFLARDIQVTLAIVVPNISYWIGIYWMLQLSHVVRLIVLSTEIYYILFYYCVSYKVGQEKLIQCLRKMVLDATDFIEIFEPYY